MNPTGLMAAAARQYQQQQQQVAQGEGVTSPADIKDPKELRKEWNNFQSWLRNQTINVKKDGKIVKENAYGNPALDKGNLGESLLNQYVQQTGSKLGIEDIPAVLKMHEEDLGSEYKKLKSGSLKYVDITDPNQRYVGAVLNAKKEPDFTNEETQKAFKIYRDKLTALNNNKRSNNPNYLGQWVSQVPLPQEVEIQTGERSGSWLKDKALPTKKVQ